MGRTSTNSYNTRHDKNIKDINQLLQQKTRQEYKGGRTANNSYNTRQDKNIKEATATSSYNTRQEKNIKPHINQLLQQPTPTTQEDRRQEYKGGRTSTNSYNTRQDKNMKHTVTNSQEYKGSHSNQLRQHKTGQEYKGGRTATNSYNTRHNTRPDKNIKEAAQQTTPTTQDRTRI